MSHPAAGAGGHGAVRAWHLGGTRTARGRWHLQCHIPMSFSPALEVPAASWQRWAATLCTRCIYPSSCCKGRGKRGEVSGTASNEEQKAERGKPDLKLRRPQGCTWWLCLLWEGARCLSPIFVPSPCDEERPVMVAEGWYALPKGSCADPGQ